MPSDGTEPPLAPPPESVLADAPPLPPVPFQPPPGLSAGSLSPDAAAPPDDWQRIAVAVRRHKWLVAAVGPARTAAGGIGGQFLNPVFQARASAWVGGPA